MPGFGFGPTIACELVKLYGGELRLAPGKARLEAIVIMPLSRRAAA